MRSRTAALLLNIAQLVGHGSVRAAVSGHLNPAPPTIDELGTMERLAKQALDDGCIGISTGLGYPPGIFASEDELAAFASWAKSRRKDLHLASARVQLGQPVYPQRSRADAAHIARSKRSYV